MAIVVGILLSLISNYLLLNTGEHNWRWMFFTGAVPAVVFSMMLLTIKKSPRWLVTKGRIGEAKKNIAELSSHEIDTEQTIKDIEESIYLENIGAKIELFKKPYRKIIIIGIFVGIFSQMTGIGVVFYYSSQIFRIAGFPGDTSMAQSVILGFTNLIFTLIAMSIIDKVGRKKLLLFGQMGMVIVLALFGLRIAYRKYFRVFAGRAIGLVCRFICSIPGSRGMGVVVGNVPEHGPDKGSFFRFLRELGRECLPQFPVSDNNRFFGTTQAKQQLGMSCAFFFFSVSTLLGFIYLKKYVIETNGKTLEYIEKEVLYSD